MTFLAIAFIAGVLTVLAPCILPLLPVVIGSSASGRSKATPYIVVSSLALSIIVFTFLLKISTAFITVPQVFWTYLSGTILVFFGVTLLFPKVWESIPGLSKLTIRSNKLLGSGHQKKSVWGDVIIGAALGPVFSTCSPTYFVILASVLPASFALGTLYLLAYVAGLSLILLLIAILGERFASRLSGISNPNSWFKRGLGVLFVLVGIFIMSGLDKQLQTYILDKGFFDITKVEQRLLQNSEESSEDTSMDTTTVTPYTEIKNPSGFVNTNNQPFQIADYVGKQVILLDIMTYSCINCQRTFPYLNAWYEKYKDDGLIVIGIHTPEFAFEKDKANVEKAFAEFGIKFPVVLDNEYATWNALGNRFWPRKYLIDIHGNVVYDHIGEGAYEETERKIQELLKERAEVLGATVKTDEALAARGIDSSKTTSKSPETYFGAARNEYFANGTQGVSGEQSLTLSDTIEGNKLYLTGRWNFLPEYAQAVQGGVVTYRYNATKVFIVAESQAGGTIEVSQDGKRVVSEAGADAPAGVVQVKDSRLYTLIKNPEPGEHTLELKVSPGVKLFAFTFG
jgi:cytochrome c biogenesis protein CcdA/thiol-disulfide isomerase/thioredoxin